MTVTQPPQLEAHDDHPSSTGARPRWARVMGSTGRFLIAAGVVIALFATFQVWGTGIQESRAQASLRGELDTRLQVARTRLADLVAQPEATTTTDPVVPIDGPSDELADEPANATETGTEGETVVDPELLALLFPENGDAVARIEIEALDVDKIVVAGTRVADLRKGPGLYRSSVLPGESGNAAIAGHRTTYGAPFNEIDELVPGDEIVVTTAQGQFTYRVADPKIAFAARSDAVAEFGPGHAIVRPDASWVLGEFDDNRLTLTACHPKLSARQRIVVVAELVSVPVALPDAVLALVAGLGPGGLDAGTPSAEPVAQDAADEPTSANGPAVSGFDLSAVGGQPDLDEGLGGERGAIPAAVAWLLLAAACWIGALRASRLLRGWPRIVPITVALGPIAIALWLCFEAADRALPAY